MGLSNAILQLGLGGRDPRRRLGNLPEKEKIHTEESTDRKWERNWGVTRLSEALGHTVLKTAMPWHFQ